MPSCRALAWPTVALVVLVAGLAEGNSSQVTLKRSKRGLGDPTPVSAVKAMTVCNGKHEAIACPNLQLIHIFNAFYGKLSGHDCSMPLRTVRDQIPTCLSKDAAQVVKETCHGQQSCDLFAEDDLYNNPCPSVQKYLFVQYACEGKTDLPQTLKMYQSQGKFDTLDRQPTVERPGQQRAAVHPHGVQSAVVCSGQTSSIGCPQLELINVKNAFFGKQSGRDCTGKLTRDAISTCFAKDAVSTIKETCHGQQSCDLFSEPELYGRSTCRPSTLQYLHVQYTCQGKSDLDSRLGISRSMLQKGNWYPYYAQAVAKGRAQQPPSVLTNAYARSPNPASYPQSANPATQFKPQALATQPGRVRQDIYGAAAMQPGAYPPVSQYAQQTQAAYGQPAAQPAVVNKCDQCNGDCRNFLCYGCGGCPEPPPEQQTYFYPYQRQDAAYHDAFAGNEMALSGLVMYPAPKMPSKTPAHSAAKSATPSAKDAEDDDDEDDDDDDDDEVDAKSKTADKPAGKKSKREVNYFDDLYENGPYEDNMIVYY